MNKKVQQFIRHNKLINRETTIDKIRAVFITGKEDSELTEKEQQRKGRLETTWSLLCKGHSTEEVVTALCELYGYSKQTGYSDVRESINLFGDVRKSSKEGQRHILHEFAMMCYKEAISQGDVTEMNRAVANMIKLLGLDRDDMQGFDPNEVQPPPIMIGFFPEDLSTDLPENWETEVAEMMKPKKAQNINVSDVEEIEYISIDDKKES